MYKKIPEKFKKSKINTNSGKIKQDLKSTQKGKAIFKHFANKTRMCTAFIKKREYF